MTQTKKCTYAFIVASLSCMASVLLWTIYIENCIVSRMVLPQDDLWQGTITHTNYGNTTPSHAAAPEIEIFDSPPVQALVLQEDNQSLNKVPSGKRELGSWQIALMYELEIPKIQVQAPVYLPSGQFWNTQKWSLLEEQMQVGLVHGTVAYPHSINAGEQGSLIIAGHSSPPNERAKESIFGSIFSRLPELEIGDEIRVLKDGKPVIYAVESSEVVAPSATEILEQQSDESLLKIITCYPVGTTTNRLVVTAKRVGLRNM